MLALFSSLDMEFIISRKWADEESFRAITTRSQPSSISLIWSASLSLRFILLRVTALPTLASGQIYFCRFYVQQQILSMSWDAFPYPLPIKRVNEITNLNSKPVSTLEHTALKYMTTAPRAHSRSKSMNSLAPPFAGLISLFWHKLFKK